MPKKRKFLHLEDNDTSGFKSKKGEVAKDASKINVLEIPQRSPDVSVMHDAVRKQIARKMRQQEESGSRTKKKRELLTSIVCAKQL